MNRIAFRIGTIHRVVRCGQLDLELRFDIVEELTMTVGLNQLQIILFCTAKIDDCCAILVLVNLAHSAHH
jgi:hypothetical protein